MRFLEFRIIEGYKEVTQKFAQEADPSQVADVIAKYKDLVNRNQVQGNERNIDWWGKQGWQRFEKFVSAKSQQQTQTQQKKRADQGRSHTIDETDKWLIVVPLDKSASCFHGKDTDWCTTKPTANHFEQYFRDGNITLIYFLQKQTGRKWAIAVNNDYVDEAEYFDQQDQPLGQAEFDAQTGLKSQKYIDMVADGTEVGRKAADSRQEMIKDKETLENLINEFGELDARENNPQIETLLLKVKDSGELRQYLTHLTDGGNYPANFDQNMQNLIANIAPDKLYTIKNITEKTRRTAVKLDPKNIRYISNPSLELVKYTVDKGSDWVFYNEIEDPSVEVIEYLAGESPFLILNYLSSQITPRALQIATEKFVKEENENIYRDLLNWFKALIDDDKDRLFDEDYYEWVVNHWSGEEQDLAVAAVVHNVFLARRIPRYKRWVVNELAPKFPKIKEYLRNFGIKIGEE
jgi:hypothetical protein